MTDYVGLKAEIAKPAYSALTDAQIVTALNTTNTSSEVPVTSAQVGTLWARRGVLGVARERATRGAVAPVLTAAEKALAWQAVDLIEYAGFDGLDPRVPAQRAAVVALLDAFVSGGIMTAGDRTATIALLTPTQTIAQSLGFARGVTLSDLIAARTQVP